MKENLSSLAASEDWIHAKPLVGVEGSGWPTPVLLCGSFVLPSLPPVFLLSCSSPIDFSPAESHVPVIHLSSPQASQASTGNRLLPDPYPSYTPSDIRICLWTIFPDLSLANVSFVFKTRAAKYLV